MKKFINISIAIYILAGILLLVLPSELYPAFYSPTLMASLAFVSVLLILLPRIVFRVKEENKKEALLRIQVTITLGLLINGAGGLGLYELYRYGIPYDKFAHFATPLIFVIGFFYFLRKWFRKSISASIILSSAAVFIGGIMWEFLEAFSDHVIGTSLFGGGTGGAFVDTVGDLSMNILGIIVATLVIKYKLKKFDDVTQ